MPGGKEESRRRSLKRRRHNRPKVITHTFIIISHFEGKYKLEFSAPALYGLV